MTQDERIIGVSGTFASGKDTLAVYLAEELGFMHVSTGDIVREETEEKYGSTDRPILKKHANEMRAGQGPGVLIDIAIERFHENKDANQLVVSGIRSIGEAESLKAAGGTLVFVDADIKVRYDRAFSRQRDVESDMSFEEFVASEAKETEVDPEDKTIQNLAVIKKMADIQLTNDRDIDHFLSTSLKALELES